MNPPPSLIFAHQPTPMTATAVTSVQAPEPVHQSQPSDNVTAILLGSTVIAAVLTTILGALRSNAATRRDQYAAATAHLAAWTEFPYRVRRRTSDSLATLDALASRGHDLQEASACHRGWVAAESRAVSHVYDDWLTEVQRRAHEPLTQAWASPKIRRPEEMNLLGFGPVGAAEALKAVEHAISYRFGWRRLLPNGIVTRLTMRSLPQRRT
jgi:hypothetical protein